MSKGSLRYLTTADMPPGLRRRVEAQLAPTVVQPLQRHQIVDPTPVASKWRTQRHVKHTSGEMNKTEARYAQHLDALISAGEVSWYGFEVIKLRLAQRCWLSIDFLVKVRDGGFELHEVKGRKGNRYFATEDGKLKVKFAAEKYPFWPVRIVWPAKGGGWDSEVLTK